MTVIPGGRCGGILCSLGAPRAQHLYPATIVWLWVFGGIYAAERARETYHCSYGFNPQYAPLFASSEMVVSAVNSRDEPHAVELTSHPFFLATAFQPERSGLNGVSHPLIAEFVRVAQSQARATSSQPLLGN